MDTDRDQEKAIVHSCHTPVAACRAGAGLVSVIVPVLNDAEALAALLPDLRAGTGLEVVVVDGGSTDASREVAASADVLVTSPPGRARQLNAGIAASVGDLVWMVHADSGISPELIRSVTELAGSPDLRWGRVDVQLADPRFAFRMIERLMNVRSRLTGICTGDQGIFVRRQVLELIGGIPELPLMEDIEFSKRVRRLARPVCLGGPIQTSARRWQQDGIGRTVLCMWRCRLRYFLGADPAVLARDYYPATHSNAG